jgi:hypothetical protein
VRDHRGGAGVAAVKDAELPLAEVTAVLREALLVLAAQAPILIDQVPDRLAQARGQGDLDHLGAVRKAQRGAELPQVGADGDALAARQDDLRRIVRGRGADAEPAGGGSLRGRVGIDAAVAAEDRINGAEQLPDERRRGRRLGGLALGPGVVVALAPGDLQPRDGDKAWVTA